ncbi:O-antigen/teichoic acid export membrane protein [Larkinella arboricola]|uniref:O-antigen/teichoic acid export membrane protein n=1 Tax=Larkinella arboricola TaxID=643671 RepID=A0A327WU71_LARAB|nr:polysaccharide biosynthesis C-terminal domain-containing protein [Larkinella arboricola]RAJ96083.1 O-antigen/teichoic acid export membrane protein [Larkinella arboricola]
MSTVSRLVSGSLASWARIGVTVLIQVALVPIFLSYWDVSTYGIWVAIQALISVLNILDRGYVDYLGYEFLKLGKDNSVQISKKLWSGIWVLLITGAVEVILVGLFSFSDFLTNTLAEGNNINQDLVWQASWTLIFQWAGWTFFSNTTGLFFRALSVWGYYSRMAWWDVAIPLLTSIASVIIVIYGGNLFMVGLGSNAFLGIITIFRFYDIFKLLKKEAIKKEAGSLQTGFNNYLISLMLSGRYFFENFRQQGIRLILTPLVGITGLAAFSTMRTGANVVQQGLLTITNPMLPELMRFLNQKEQDKMEATFGTVWFVLICVLSPGVMVLQAVVEPIFVTWTKGKILFDPILFGALSASILVYSVAQPAMAIIVGNNQLKKQIVLSIISAFVLLASLLVFIPIFGLAGAGLALLVAEIFTASGLIMFAKKWLNANNLSWPNKASNSAILSILITAIGMVFLKAFPDKAWMALLTYAVFSLSLSMYYWNNTPDLAKVKLTQFINKFFITNA